MRTVIIGEPGKLRRLAARDLPRDLRDSYWRWVDFSGVDLSAYNMAWMDIIDCDARGAIVSPQVRGMVSRRTDWRGAVIPANLPSDIYDLVPEAVRQVSAPEVGAIVVQKQSDYRSSWFDTIPVLDAQLGRGWRKPTLAALAVFPLLARRLKYHLDQNVVGVRVDREANFSVVKIGGRAVDLSGELAGAKDSYDRWAMARTIEALLASRGDKLRSKVHVGQLHPFPMIYIKAAEEIHGDMREAIGGRDG